MYKFSVEQLDDNAPETVIGLIEDAIGYFAAGDVRTKALRQVITAAADGANAAHWAEEYLLKQV